MSAKLRLLYIDDDAAFARLVTRALTRQGFDVVHATDGAAGLQALDSVEAGGGPFDAVALDHVMPGMSGPETLDAICRRKQPPPVIYVTAADEGKVAVTALKAGAADYVLKDLGGVFFDLLGETIRQAVVNQRARRAQAAAQAEIAAARDRAEAMLQEVNHRVANSLALVSSFAHLQAAQMPEGDGRDAVMDLKRRIAAVGQVHRRLYTSEDVGRVELSSYLQGLVDELRATVADECGVTAIRLQAETVLMPTDKAIALGVVLSELVTNACKYAYPDGFGGEIAVSLRREDEDTLLLVVADEGVGFAQGQVRGSGLGRRIIQAMSKSLKAELRYEPAEQGTRAVLKFPAG
ncbi:response regulator [Sandaracinobacteroides hominis]|uniref:response regulator n=1 Tax=Sandaracinobacteroides hominis TaxID=2780086 RepID=UPI0018F35604|nr:response regulator [Sandaracinobacteroides hominis]